MKKIYGILFTINLFITGIIPFEVFAQTPPAGSIPLINDTTIFERTEPPQKLIPIQSQNTVQPSQKDSTCLFVTERYKYLLNHSTDPKSWAGTSQEKSKFFLERYENIHKNLGCPPEMLLDATEKIFNLFIK